MCFRKFADGYSNEFTVTFLCTGDLGERVIDAAAFYYYFSSGYENTGGLPAFSSS